MPIAPRPSPERSPPRGVPRWLWPPPGAAVQAFVVRERADGSGRLAYDVASGDAPAARHLRALQWLLDEHPRSALPEPGCPFEGEVRVDVARTPMPGGRVGHAYALNGGPLGAPSGDGARGILWRYIEHVLGS